MIIFAQLCYCIYYENYYNSFIMKNKKNYGAQNEAYKFR